MAAPDIPIPLRIPMNFFRVMAVTKTTIKIVMEATASDVAPIILPNKEKVLLICSKKFQF